MKIGRNEITSGGNQINEFSALVLKGMAPLAGDNDTAVGIALAAIEGTLSDIVGGRGQFAGLSSGELVRAKNGAIDEAIAMLSGLIGCSARVAVCTAIVALGSASERSRIAEAA